MPLQVQDNSQPYGYGLLLNWLFGFLRLYSLLQTKKSYHVTAIGVKDNFFRVLGPLDLGSSSA